MNAAPGVIPYLADSRLSGNSVPVDHLFLGWSRLA